MESYETEQKHYLHEKLFPQSLYCFSLFILNVQHKPTLQIW